VLRQSPSLLLASPLAEGRLEVALLLAVLGEYVQQTRAPLQPLVAQRPPVVRRVGGVASVSTAILAAARIALEPATTDIPASTTTAPLWTRDGLAPA